MKKLVKLFALLLMPVFHTACGGQNQTSVPKDTTKPETIEVISTDAPGNIVRKIIQDRKGNIWMASWEGMIRYDGKSFTNITNKVSSARFFSVAEDRKGNFWFGTIGSGAYYYDGNSFQHFTTREGLLNNEVTSIYEDKKDNIWFGVSGGASCYDGKSFQNYIIDDNGIHEDLTGKTFPDRQPNGVHTIIEDKTGKLWMGTNGDACTFDGTTFTVCTNNEGKTFKNAWAIFEDKAGNIWLGADDGLWRYDGSTFTKLSEKGALSILEDKNGNIWTSAVVGRSCELLRYNANSLSNEKPTVTIVSEGGINHYFGILEDFDGGIWAGTGSGVCRYDGKAFTAYRTKKQPH